VDEVVEIRVLVVEPIVPKPLDIRRTEGLPAGRPEAHEIEPQAQIQIALVNVAGRGGKLYSVRPGRGAIRKELHKGLVGVDRQLGHPRALIRRRAASRRGALRILVTPIVREIDTAEGRGLGLILNRRCGVD
jgi:hypothetical protein